MFRDTRSVMTFQQIDTLDALKQKSALGSSVKDTCKSLDCLEYMIRDGYSTYAVMDPATGTATIKSILTWLKMRNDVHVARYPLWQTHLNCFILAVESLTGREASTATSTLVSHQSALLVLYESHKSAHTGGITCGLSPYDGLYVIAL